MKPEIRPRTVTLTLRFSVFYGSCVRFDAAALQERLQAVFETWDDGRQGFAVESTRRAVEEMFAAAAQRTVEAKMFVRHGRKMVKTGPGSQTAKAVVEAEKILRGFRVYNVRADRATVGEP